MLRSRTAGASSIHSTTNSDNSKYDANDIKGERHSLRWRAIQPTASVCIVLILSILLCVVLRSFLSSFTTAASSSDQLDTSTGPQWRSSRDNAFFAQQHHVVFSTDCSEYQHWQSFALFHSAKSSNQPGTVTRIASGCNPDQEEQLLTWHTKYIAPMGNNSFHLHFTPPFSSIQDEQGRPGKKYEFFNKPFGLLHYLEQYYIGSSSTDPKRSSSLQINSHDILILLDPDQILIRPITQDTAKSTSGRPFGQRYGFGGQWVNLKLTRITSLDSASRLVSPKDAATYYAVGPPYVATVSDFYSIAQKWVEFVPLIHKEYPHLLAEMFAYCIAAAHLKLPHIILDNLMVSDHSISKGEGWEFIQNVPPEEVCPFASHAVMNSASSMHIDNQTSLSIMPNVLHLCQRYMVGEWFFYKRKVPTNYFTCESPILQTPPSNLATLYDYRIAPGTSRDAHIPMEKTALKKSVFMICAATKALQDAAIYFKTEYCSTSTTTTNWEQDLNLFELFYK